MKRPRLVGGRPLWVALFLGWVSVAAVGCASIPKGQYGVKRIEWIGTEKMDERALESCLVTRERERVTLLLGVSSPSCGKPPFDSSAPTLELWTLPWSEWPMYDPAIFDVERERIERWYHARGYYDARVTDVKTFVGDKPVDPNECHGSGSQCELKVVVSLSEGAATYVDGVEIKTDAPLPAALLERLHKKLNLREGKRLDESDYEDDKTLLEKMLIEASYARSQVSGEVLIDRNRRTAHVQYRLSPGPACVFGDFTVEGAQSDVPIDLLVQAADIPKGKQYDQDVVDDAQRALFALNVFSSVRIERRGQGKVVDLVAIVQRGRITQLSAGLGLMAGTMARATSAETEPPLPQWDLHLSGTYENRNFLGGLRRLRLEERPRAIFMEEFPRIPNGGPRPGNLISVRFEQPATFERLTKLVVAAGWDFGPDPFAGFFRHDLSAKVGLERQFWHQRLLGRVAVAHDLYDITDGMVPDEGYSSYRLPYIEQQIVFDLRNDPRRPSKGLYFSFLIQESSKLGGYGSWNYVRIVPDLRAYVPLPLSIVLAARFALGALLIEEENGSLLDQRSARLGPNAYRLRGGGASSNRGFAAGTLGDSKYGGTRRFEGSVELRIPLGSTFGFVAFFDVGNVTDPGTDDQGHANKSDFRFKQLNAATGFGLRLFTILGSIRFDSGWRIPGLQTLGVKNDGITFGFWPSALHLTIGEAF